ncbi:MAG: flagella basal body P-ring formation protein FlgA [Phycisphaerae bacterium]
MNNKIISLIAVMLICFAVFAGQDNTLRIHLPREAQISEQAITLGQVSIIRGPQSLVDKASDIGLGEIYDSEREIVLSRTMILGRLSCSEIDTSSVEFSGANEIKITSQISAIAGSQFVEAAQAFLAQNITGGLEGNYTLVRTPNNLSVPGSLNDVKLSYSLMQQDSDNRIGVEIAVLLNDKEIGTRQVLFQRQRQTQQSEPRAARQARPEVLVRRNRHVSVVISKPGLYITSVGRALEDGREGDFIKVRMHISDSSRNIIARVNSDGTVEPVL